MWSLVFCVLLLTITKQLKKTIGILRQPGTLALLALTSLLLTINWGVYIWSVSVNRIVEASLGYYITPLASVGFGVFILHENMRRFQKVAVGLASVGVLVLTIEYGTLPWIAIALAISWSSYTLVKKTLKLGALEGLSIETLVALFPNLIYLTYIESQGKAEFGQHFGFSLLLMCAGLVTVVPLLLFNGATTRLPLTLTGLLQYITPTIMFTLGVVVNHESMPAGRVIGFSLIWVALVFLGVDLVRSNRTPSGTLQDQSPTSL